MWTHNCEHGILIGSRLRYVDGSLEFEGEGVQFGPEQLTARIGRLAELVPSSVPPRGTKCSLSGPLDKEAHEVLRTIPAR